MSESKHTPGPWEVELNKRAWGWVEVKGPSFAVHGPTRATDLRLSDEIRRIADARLIAAAPDLLGFARRVSEGCSFPENEFQRALRDEARKVIAKA